MKGNAAKIIASARIDVLESAIRLLLDDGNWTDATMGEAIDVQGRFVRFDDPKAVAWTLTGAVRLAAARHGMYPNFADDLLDLVWAALSADRIRPRPITSSDPCSEPVLLWSDWEDGLPSSSLREWNSSVRDVGQVTTLLGITAFLAAHGALGRGAMETLARRLEPLLCVAP